MNYYLSLAALVPAVILFVRIYQLDRIEKEPRRLLGIADAVQARCPPLPAAGIQLLASRALGGALNRRSAAYLLLDNFLVVAVSEEVCKIVPVRLAAWKHPAFDYRFDAVVYSVSSALGFAAVENILYVVQSDLRTAVSRAVLSVPGHFFLRCRDGTASQPGQAGRKAGKRPQADGSVRAGGARAGGAARGLGRLCLAVRRPWATVVFYCFVVAFFIAADLGLRRASQTDAHL